MRESGLKDVWRFTACLHASYSCFWVVVLILLGLIIANPYRINEDCALRIQLAQWVLEGKYPYVDFVDVTPPAATYLSVIPVVLSRLFSINVIFTFSITVLALAAWSTWTIRQVVDRSGICFETAQLGAMLFLWTLFSVLMYKRGYFGEREHLFVLLYLPFLVVRWVGAQQGKIAPSTALVVGFAAGIGTCIKPYFVLVALMPELYWLLQRRNPGLYRPEVGTYLCAGALFLLHFLLLPDSAVVNMFGRWLPFIVDRYNVYNCDLSHLVLRRDFLFAAVGIVGPFLIKPNPKGGLGELARPLSMSVLGAAMAFVLQHKGFSYQLFPAVGLAAVGITVSAYEVMTAKTIDCRGFSKRKTTAVQLICTLMFSATFVFLILMMLSSIVKAPRHYPSTPVEQAVSELSKKDEAVLVISPAVGASYPMLLQLARTPATRFANIFWIGMLYPDEKMAPNGEFPYRSPEEAGPEETRLLGELAEDICTFRPVLVVIPNKSYCHGCPTGFNILRYLEKNGLMEIVLKNYALVRTLPKFNIYKRLN